jgi:hypothetical protein
LKWLPDRLLKLIDKGVTVEQVAMRTRNFTEANVMVAYYLCMVTLPKPFETVNGLEMSNCLKLIVPHEPSGFWRKSAASA